MEIYLYTNNIFRWVNGKIHKILFSTLSIIETIYLQVIGINVQHCSFLGWTSVYKKDSSLIKIGKNCIFNSSSYVNHLGINHRCILFTAMSGAKLEIGDNCGFSGVSISAFKSIRIGDNVRCGANVIIMDSDFHLDDSRTLPPSPIEIQDNVWLGEGVKVLKGVTIGENTIVGAGSIVTKDLPNNVIAAGCPCRVVRKQ